MAFTEADRQAMDDAAVEAENDLNTSEEYKDEVVLPMANWFFKWYVKAGYKRLGRILVQIAKDKQSK